MPSGTNSHHTAAAFAQRRAVFANRLVEPEVADRDVDPAVDAHANAVRRMVSASLVDFIGADAFDQHFALVGRAIAVDIMKDGQKRRMKNPQRTVVINSPRG